MPWSDGAAWDWRDGNAWSREWDAEQKRLVPRTVRRERRWHWLVMLHDRFWSHVDRSGGPDACWPWRGAVTKNGYGNYSFKGDGERSSKTAQRVAWMLTYGSIEPEELQVDHIDCVTKLCMNPEHLQLLTLEENVRKG